MTDSNDLLIRNQIHQKIEKIFEIIKKNFTKDSEPVYFNDSAEKLTLKKIHEIESVNEKSISLIAVTRHQYDTSNFLKYENYIKTILGFSRIYYGLWPDNENRIEYDVLYVIPTDNFEDIQNHLNAHNHMNQGFAQRMALIIFSDGESKPVGNYS
jgi:hypothetical protein